MLALKSVKAVLPTKRRETVVGRGGVLGKIRNGAFFRLVKFTTNVRGLLSESGPSAAQVW